MRVSDKQLYSDIRSAHVTYCLQSQAVKKSIEEATSLEDLADTIYTLRESAKFMEWIRKDIQSMLTLAEKLCCLAWVRRGVPENIKTAHCNAAPNVKHSPKIPKEGSEDYEKLLQFYGVPSGTPFRPHWPALRDRISEDIAAGRNVPPGIDPNAMLPAYTVSTRKKQDILSAGDGTTVTDPDLVAATVQRLQQFTDVEAREMWIKLHDVMTAITELSQGPRDQHERDLATAQASDKSPAPVQAGRPDFSGLDEDEEDEENPF